MAASPQRQRCVVYVQRRAHKAGAQTCLVRLLRHPAVRQWNPVVVCAENGWLTGECARFGIPAIQCKFPPSRTIAARLVQNRLFVRRVAARLRAMDCEPSIVHANDHGEGLLALGLAREFKAKTGIFLRSSGMSKRDYFKYRCGEFDLVAAIGPKLETAVRNWGVTKPLTVLYDGLYAEEVLSPKSKAAEFPHRWLVIGTPHPAKGWSDLTEALYRLQSNGKLQSLQLDFTGTKPSAQTNDLKVDRLKNTTAKFLGRVEDFVSLVREYDLVINPSRAETSGMAALEVIAAGVPLLSSRAGAVELFQACPHLLFEAGDPQSLADALAWLFRNWQSFDPMIAASQKKILLGLNMDDAAEALLTEYKRLVHHA